MQIEEQLLQEATILTISGALDFKGAGTFKDKVLSIKTDDPAHILVNLQGVSFIDSAIIGTLAILHKTLLLKNTKLSLIVLPESFPDRALRYASLDTFLPLFQDQESALAACPGSPNPS